MVWRFDLFDGSEQELQHFVVLPSPVSQVVEHSVPLPSPVSFLVKVRDRPRPKGETVADPRFGVGSAQPISRSARSNFSKTGTISMN